MIHYVSLQRESMIGGLESWIVTDCLKEDKDPTLIPTLMGIGAEIQHDNLDFDRVLEFLTDDKWVLIDSLSRPVETADGEVQVKPVSSSYIVSFTVPEFLQMKAGALTGLFFSADGTFKRAQRYFFDRTPLP